MNRLSVERRAMILRCLTEGNSIRATTRLTEASKTTILKLIAEFGEFATWYQDKMLVDLPCTDIQIDEIWSFCGCKEKNREKAITKQHGDVWTWTSLCRDTKLTPSWLVADRSYSAAQDIVNDLAGRLTNRVQISTDGNRAYLYAVSGAFNGQVDFGRLIKVYGQDASGNEIVIRCEKEAVVGNPDMERVCTSHVERQNLTMRMCMRRFTRLTNAFSKKIENHAAMTAIHFLNYNFTRKHQTIKTAPAVAAGVIDKPVKLEELVAQFDSYRNERFPVQRPKTYKKRSTVPASFAPQEPKTPWYLNPLNPESQAKFDEIREENSN